MFIVAHNLLSLYSAPDARSEMVSQALLGEPLDILESEADFSHVRTEDGYEGWGWRAHIAQWDESGRDGSRQQLVTAAFADVRADVDGCPGHELTRLSMGSRVQVRETANGFAVLDLPSGALTSRAYVHVEDIRAPDLARHSFHDLLLRYAFRLIGTPYLWGGTSAFGIDCSGYVQRVFGLCGMRLPRDAYLQAAVSRADLVRTEPEADAARADIVFFEGNKDPRNRGITHTGIALDRERFIHASGRNGVCVNRFDDAVIIAEYKYRGGLRATESAPG